MKKRIFVVDDDKNIRQLLSKFLEKEGFEVVTFSDSDGVMMFMNSSPPDCIVLDVMMPGKSGLDLCRQIRHDYATPIIFLSAKGEEIDRILGIELGGDDYLIKPFSPRELVVRIKALLRRSSSKLEYQEQSSCQLGNIKIDEDARILLINDEPITLTNKEFQLLQYLVQNANKAMSREQIVDFIWGYDYIGEMRSVDDLIRRLRKKLRDGESSVVIETVWGYGYKLKEE